MQMGHLIEKTLGVLFLDPARRYNAKSEDSELPNSSYLFWSAQYFIGGDQIGLFNNGGRTDDSICRIFIGRWKKVCRKFGNLWADALKYIVIWIRYQSYKFLVVHIYK